MSEERSQQNTGAEEAPVVRRGRGDDAPAREGAAGQEPDVVLDVSELEVDRINLEVEDLRAHVSVLAELANLLHLSVGVDARLERVKLEIEGVEAKVLLKVRLEHVRAILEKALDTIAEHPEILRILARSLSELVRERLGETLSTLDDVLEGLEVGDTVDEVLRERLEAVRATLVGDLGAPTRRGAEQWSLGGRSSSRYGVVGSRRIIRRDASLVRQEEFPAAPSASRAIKVAHRRSPAPAGVTIMAAT